MSFKNMPTSTTHMFANYTEANCQEYVRNKIIHLRHDSIKKKRVQKVSTIAQTNVADYTCANYSCYKKLCFHNRNEAFWFECSNECRWVRRLPDPHNEKGRLPDPHNECRWVSRLPNPHNEKGRLPDSNIQTNMNECRWVSRLPDSHNESLCSTARKLNHHSTDV